MLVLPNLYGDIVSDLTAGLVGGLGRRAGGEHRHGGGGVRGDPRLRAQVHGAEQGQPDRDDPLGKLMLDHIDERDARASARGGGRRGDRRGQEVTYDLKPTATTRWRSGRPSTRTRHRTTFDAKSHYTKGSDVNGRKKVTVVGAGNVGATCALEEARRDYADVVLRRHPPELRSRQGARHEPDGVVTGYEPTIIGSERYDRDRRTPTFVMILAGRRLARASGDDLRRRTRRSSRR